MSLDFLVTSLIVVVSPGTGVLYTLAAGLSRGRRASVVAAFGCTLGIVPHMGAAIMGLAALLHTSALAFQTLKYLGLAYLLYMAWDTLREKGGLRVEEEVGTRSATQVIVSAILINILNPFDPLVIQRKRLAAIFNYEHRFEAYVPKEKRVFGYFAQPVLVGDEIVAVLDLKTDRERGKLLVQKWTWLRKDGRAARRELIEDALHRFEQFQLAR